MKLFCMIPQQWIHVIIHLSKSIEHTTPRMNPNNVNYGLQVMTMYRCRFTSYSKGTPLVGDGVIWEGCNCGLAGVCGGILYSSLSFLKDFIYFQREKGGSATSMPLIRALMGDQSRNPGMCPDQDSNWRPFTWRGDAPPTEPHRSGLHSVLP